MTSSLSDENDTDNARPSKRSMGDSEASNAENRVVESGGVKRQVSVLLGVIVNVVHALETLTDCSCTLHALVPCTEIYGWRGSKARA